MFEIKFDTFYLCVENHIDLFDFTALKRKTESILRPSESLKIVKRLLSVGRIRTQVSDFGRLLFSHEKYEILVIFCFIRSQWQKISRQIHVNIDKYSINRNTLYS